MAKYLVIRYVSVAEASVTVEVYEPAGSLSDHYVATDWSGPHGGPYGMVGTRRCDRDGATEEEIDQAHAAMVAMWPEYAAAVKSPGRSARWVVSGIAVLEQARAKVAELREQAEDVERAAVASLGISAGVREI